MLDTTHSPAADRGGSRLATGLTLTGLAAGASAMSYGFHRPTGRQAAITIASGLAGLGVGAFGAHPLARELGDGDAATGGVLLAGAGIAAIAASRLVPSVGVVRDGDAVVRSLGQLAAVGGGAAAGASLLSGPDPDTEHSLGVGAVLGVGAGVAALAVLGSTGALRAAPRYQDAGRRVVEPSAEFLASATKAQALDLKAGTSDAARRLHDAQAGAGPGSFESLGTGKPFLRSVMGPAEIRRATGDEMVRQPRRILVGVGEGERMSDRADLLLRRFDDADGTSFGTIHVVSGTANGDTNIAVPATTELAKRGDVITIMAQSSMTPAPQWALHKLPGSERMLQQILEGVHTRIAAMPEGERPQVVLSGLCYGSIPAIKQRGEDGSALHALGVTKEFYSGPPAISRAARTLAGRIQRGEEPGGALLRGTADARARTLAGETPDVTVLVHADDQLRAAQQTLLVPSTQTPGKPFLPILSMIGTYGEFGLDQPVAGRYVESAHQFPTDAPSATNLAFDLGLTPAQLHETEQLLVEEDHLRGLAQG